MPVVVNGRCREGLPSRFVVSRSIALAGCLAMGCAAHAQETPVVEFDAAFLPVDERSTLDLSRYSHGNPVLPGNYEVDIWMNGEWQVRKNVRFESKTGRADATPCIAHDELLSFGLSLDVPATPADDPCRSIGERIDAATSRLDIGEQRLYIEVPQAAMMRRSSAAVPPAQWDQGIDAGLLAWRTNVRHTSSANRRRTSAFVGIDAGLNLDAWRVRHAGAWSGRRYRGRYGFVERQLGTWRSQLRVGDIAPADDLFAPVRLRGLSVASDARMSVDASDGYMPRVTGTAASHATVRVTQNGMLLRELTVPPGAFVIDDLHAAGRGGDIEVDVLESDGVHRTFRIPFFPVPELLREGHTGYALSAGQARPGRGRAVPLVQASWRHGFPHDITLYTGWRQWPRQTSVVLGGAVDTLAGALAMDITHSAFQNGRNGRLWRLRHGKQWRDGTLVSLSVARGRETSLPTPTTDRSPLASMRRTDLIVQRDLGDERGSLSASISHVSRKRDGGTTVDHAMSWTRGWRRATMDLSLRRSRHDTTGQWTLSVPLGTPASSTNLHASLLGEHSGGARIGVSGSVGDDGTLLYGAALAGHRHEGQRLDASLTKALPVGEVSASIERTDSVRGGSLSAAGGVVFHAGGITFAQRLGEASALVRARGAGGARVGAGPGILIDRSGHAVVSHLTPFRWNSVDLDPSGLPLDVALASTHRRVAPTSGAVVLVPFVTDVATTFLVTAAFADGTPLPFAAEVVDDGGRSVGVIGQAGRVFLRGKDARGRWTVRWEGIGGRCDLQLLTTTKTAAGDVRHIGVCK